MQYPLGIAKQIYWMEIFYNGLFRLAKIFGGDRNPLNTVYCY